ncbi:branched-chain-amino-acid transaminase [Parasulfuritortus cantonensis]|uniref:Branched-chain-amino-acid aminotransferase n=1 Tax=Parasulfuritortus cantonensis TaxID=2528202 RepID=A0A4V2NVW1_9PROT|nr:branched-chain-amino-acid transaminase [Parasulfuritortus cantonensis]TCJ14962.1 branched-chain-amino-acid transaminase [Parasulfuritortus cantonensis]
MHEHAVCWLNGRLVPTGEARISVFDHGLLYGDGVFEGIRFYNRRPFKLAAHLERFLDSARAIALDLPYSRDDLGAAVTETVAAFAGPDGYLRLVATRGEGALGIDPRNCARPSLFVIADRLSMVARESREQGARLIIAATRRLPPDGLDPRIKSLNYLNHILARIEANQAGADEAILLNAAGRVTEGTADNVFVVRHGRLLTPPPVEGALAGITRETVLELALAAGIPVSESALAPYDLYTADECFLTGTGAELIPVAEVDGRRMAACPGPFYRELARRYEEIVRA